MKPAGHLVTRRTHTEFSDTDSQLTELFIIDEHQSGKQNKSMKTRLFWDKAIFLNRCHHCAVQVAASESVFSLPAERLTPLLARWMPSIVMRSHSLLIYYAKRQCTCFILPWDMMQSCGWICAFSRTKATRGNSLHVHRCSSLKASDAKTKRWGKK